ncbi:MAG: cytochrome c oxidase subunit 3 [Planctomycetota bacterium]
MSFFSQLTEKPWLNSRSRAADLPEGSVYSLPAPTVAVRLILAVATVVFTLFIVAYGDRMALSDWRPLPEPSLLWANTIILMLSSAAWHWATINARQGRIDGVKIGLLAGGGFAFAFLIGQYWAWQQLEAAGYYADTNPANAFFYLLTAVHAVHLLGGLVAWGRTVSKVWRGVEVARVRLSVELCAVYWHFLLVVWLVLFALLLFT